MAPSFRYRLQPYAGPKSRAKCPGCGRPRSFSRFLDTKTGELLPETYGRCDRENNCAYFVTPYQPEADGLTYANRVYQQGNEAGACLLDRPRRSRPVAAPTPVLIPDSVYRASLGHYPDNQLAQLLRTHFGRGIADELLARFRLGTCAYWPGACIFWLIDEHGRIRGGQVVLYDETGHTVKKPGADGEVFRYTRPVHTLIGITYRRRGQPAPPWLDEYAAPTNAKSPCLFGLPQLDAVPASKLVAIVESAKTAMLCTPYWPEFIWLATMGQAFLTPERLACVKGRRIVLFPDAGSLGKWQQQAEKLRGLGFLVEVATEFETLVTSDQKAAGLDLADVLLAEWPGYPPSLDASPDEHSPLNP